MVYVLKGPHSYRGQESEKGRYLSEQMSARVEKGLIRERSPKGIEWYSSRSVRMRVAPGSRQFDSTCPGNTCTKV